MRELFSFAKCIKLFLLLLLQQIKQGYGGRQTQGGCFSFQRVCEVEHCEVLSHNWIGLFAPSCFVRYCIERSLDVVDSHAVVFGVVDADPPEPDCFEFAFELRVYADAVSILEVNK
jgi:hypothetical protein